VDAAHTLQTALSLTSGRSINLQVSAMFGMFGKPNQLPEAKDCLPGREEEMHISNQHYVTGNPIKGPFPDNLEVTVFGTGCFWGTEKGFWRIPGVFSTAVGYAGGHTPNANYREVCSGLTGHNEVVQVVWDPTKVSYADLLIMFWTSHDPTQGMRQGNDAGTQVGTAPACVVMALQLRPVLAWQSVVKWVQKGSLLQAVHS